MKRKPTVKNIISALSVYGITKTGRHYRGRLVEDEFNYKSSIGEPFTFVLIHNDTPEWFAKDFRAYLNCLTFKAYAYEQDVRVRLTEACEAVERLVEGA